MVNFEQRIEPGGLGGVEQRVISSSFKRPHDNENRTRAGLPRLEHLDGVHHEILAQAGRRGRRRGEKAVTPRRSSSVPPKEFLVRQDGQGVRLRLLW